MDSDRFERGWAQLNELDSGAAERVVESVRDVAPERDVFEEKGEPMPPRP